MQRAPVVVFALLAAVSLPFSVGCASKKYVRNQSAPTINKVNELDDLTAKNTRDIHDVDSRAQQGIKDAQSKADQANQHALTAGQAADQAQSAANQASNRVTSLSNTVANLDDYKPVTEATVHFGFNKWNLTKDAQSDLDKLGDQLASAKHYIVVVDGNTDSTGPADYNYMLSQRRADAVIQYLAQKYQLPTYKIFVIGLGKDKPAQDNKSRQGRAENRRVDVRLMTNVAESGTQQSAASTPQQ